MRSRVANREPQFLQRSRAISLYREIIRGTRRIADPTTRAESRRYARDEFERHRDVTDIVRLSQRRLDPPPPTCAASRL